MTESWLLYGANGYTGELIAREAVARGMRPVLAGRSRAKVEQLAAELGCKSAIFDLDDHTSLVRALDGMTVALHCAGPFSKTARSMMQGCLATHVHYLDCHPESSAADWSGIGVSPAAQSRSRNGAASRPVRDNSRCLEACGATA